MTPIKIEPHSKFGANIRPVINMCVICQDQYRIGSVPLGNMNYKYICPSCNFVTYGLPPDAEEDGMIHCPECHSIDRSWEMKELIEGEMVKGGFGICPKCMKKLGKNKIALIEVEDGTDKRTGEIYFVKTPKWLKDYYDKGERYLNIEKSSCIKLKLREKDD